MAVSITDHAVERYRERSGERLSAGAIVKRLREMYRNADGFRAAEGAKAWLSDGWILIQDGNSIVTVYPAADKNIPSPKRKKKRRARRPRTADLLEAG